jgi:exopolysaccharide biosynthesis polyprenyl glycosylphosphotransferase
MPDELATRAAPDRSVQSDVPDVVGTERHGSEGGGGPLEPPEGRWTPPVVAIVGLVALAVSTMIALTAGAPVLALSVAAAGLATLGLTAIRTRSADRQTRPHRAVIVGAGDVGQLVARKLLRHPEYGIDLVGFVDRPPKRWRRDASGVPVLGRTDELVSIIGACGIDRVIVAFSATRDKEMLAAVRAALARNVRVDVVPRLFEVIGPESRLPHVEGIPLISIANRRRSAVAMFTKRAIDIVGATVGLVVAAPLFLWAAWRIPRDTPGPVFFRQTRLGRHMQEFTMLKFRTMRLETDDSLHHAYLHESMNGDGGDAVEAGELYKADHGDVVTRPGNWLRRTSLDEVPQLINVLRGDMSLVGPRPCLRYETEYFAPHHYERFLVPAGITGLWQVTARAHAGFAEALEMDVIYARDWSLRLDLSLLLRTPVEVLRQRRATR